MNYKEALGVTIRRYRQRLGLSQEELARRAGLHRTYIGSIERGERNITLVNIIRLAQGLEVDSVRLFEEMKALKEKVDRQVGSAVSSLV
ncbi:MAG TPA: XRE family transcriptional regulator [Candidatus Coatesbacteria bacterium]|nr:XRE family transcriptional regulator [Candidatus Coatesbacteria bacterium]